jgi:AraC family transcriptional regulator
MSKSKPASVTPKIDRSDTPVLPPCNVPYRRILYVGRCVNVYFDPHQPEAVWHEHQHPEVQVLYLGPGSDCTIHWMQEGRWTSRHVHTPSLWVIGADVSHKLEWRRPALRLVFYVRPAFVAECAGLEITGSSLVPFENATRCDPKVAEFLRSFERLEQPRTETESIQVESLASLASMHLFQAWNCLTSPTDIWATAMSNENLAKIDTFIKRHIEQKILLVDMAREVGMSESNFARMFKRLTGVSPGQYLIDQRIQKSKTLLVSDDCRIGEVALAVGFSSQGHFDLFFKRRVGMTPKEYRSLQKSRRNR